MQESDFSTSAQLEEIWAAPHRALTLSRTFSSLKASATATAAAQDTAFPAYVPPYSLHLDTQSDDGAASLPSFRALACPLAPSYKQLR